MNSVNLFMSTKIDGDMPAKLRERKSRASFLSFRDRWLTNTLHNIRYRCTNPKDRKYKYYGGRGVQNLLTLDDLQFLYDRDRPDLMRKPSIDRRERTGNYERDNCRFIELLDNIQSRGKNEWPCEKCGISAFPRKIRGKNFCQPCAAEIRLAEFRYPGYVQYAVDLARQHRLIVEPVLPGKSLKPLQCRIKINDHFVGIHYAKATSHTVGSQKYWRFNITDTSPAYHIFVAKHFKSYRCWIFQGAPKGGRTLYVPSKEAEHSGAPSAYDWPLLEDAWHLLAPATEQQKAS
jgi:hypothetical protein